MERARRREPWVAALADASARRTAGASPARLSAPPFRGRADLADPERLVVGHAQELDADGLVANVASRSTTILLGAPERAALLARVRGLAPPGRFALPYLCDAWRSPALSPRPLPARSPPRPAVMARGRRPRPPLGSCLVADRPDELFLIDGNSLAYRAFFALPESIATSTGLPTNAIFGFASMLVKLLTEHGQKPTIVVWDAGSAGRKEITADYKAQRASRPDLLRGAVAAPGADRRRLRLPQREGRRLRGRRRHRFAGREGARGGHPVTVVTGDRDAFQIIDPDGVTSWPPAAASPTPSSTTTRP